MDATVDKEIGANESEGKSETGLLKTCDKWDRKISSYIFKYFILIITYIVLNLAFWTILS